MESAASRGIIEQACGRYLGGGVGKRKHGGVKPPLHRPQKRRAELLDAEPYRDQHLESDRLIIESRWLVFPLSQRLHGCLLQECRTRDYLQETHAARRANLRLDDDVALDPLQPGQ